MQETGGKGICGAAGRPAAPRDGQAAPDFVVDGGMIGGQMYTRHQQAPARI